MKLSLYAAAALLFLGMAGCNGTSQEKVDNFVDQQGPAGKNIMIRDLNGNEVAVSPQTGGSVIVAEDQGSGTKDVDIVVPGYINDCIDGTVDADGDGVICGPKEGITYAFQLDFGELGPLDNLKTTPDGGALLYDAVTHYDGEDHQTPLEGDASENRIRTVYIPTNYIKLSEASKQLSTEGQYQVMKSYLDDMFHMQFMVRENSENKFFKDGKTSARFVATYVMFFPRGENAAHLVERLHADRRDLEFLAVSFEVEVKQDGEKIRFTSPEGTNVTLYGKKHGEGELILTTDNSSLNSILHTNHDYVHPSFSLNIGKYFNKLIEKGDDIGVSDYAKGILVDNAQHPWPVKVYGTLHEIRGSGFDRSFVRNPAKLDANLFGLDLAGSYRGAFLNETLQTPKRGVAQAMEFAIVYPGQ